ncbi:uncharacterized protein LAESUDRAFT_413302 [Laetiporus sulphureus 93-53]|uniref:Uncharacterized protein n=1 Tax=Laetiporus sulphureus 93-53 TaxID=1314785 RepID=A0A165C7M4_9APHY|nr:uncharacterized protein LAESUDRAFT_413302 [Laetiporus sulphureus 93-53]KZT02341.1 hypothetical protein LAESUDRAFT_413302 [Laetiporus sulphureus 93-53]
MLFYDLSQLPLTNLKHLHLGETNLCWCRPSAASDYDYLWIVAMLHIINGNSTCASLARLTISVDPNIAKPPAPTAGEDGILSVPGLGRLPWHLIDRNLAALLEKLPALEVVFLVRAPNELEEDVALAHFVQHLIASRLPRSRAKSGKCTIRHSMDGSNTVQYTICPAFGDAEATGPSLF